MRPIDADSLMEKLNGIWDCNDMTFAPVDGCCIDVDCKSCRWRETIEYVKRLVQNQTTISPWPQGRRRRRTMFNVFKRNKEDRCVKCTWFHKENGTCQKKKCAGYGYGYVTKSDRRFCECSELPKEDET